MYSVHQFSKRATDPFATLDKEIEQYVEQQQKLAMDSIRQIIGSSLRDSSNYIADIPSNMMIGVNVTVYIPIQLTLITIDLPHVPIDMFSQVFLSNSIAYYVPQNIDEAQQQNTQNQNGKR